MSTGLLLYDGGLLFVDGGLTNDPNCCCYYEPATCPPCCIRIDWGTFNVDGDLVDDYVASGIPIAVKIIMPTKNSRFVCNDDQVTVQWEMDAPADEYGAWVRFGAAWFFVGESPLVGASGETYEWGLVDWIGTSSSTFQVTLRFRECFLDTGQFLGFIVIGMDFPDWDLEIDITRCVTASYCCRPTVVCEDCCALLDLDNKVFYDGKHYIVVNNVDGLGQIWTGVLEITLEAVGKVCDGASVLLTLFLVPPRHGDIENNTVVTFPKPWILGPFSPAINLIDGEETEIKLDWGTLTATSYDISLGLECEEKSCGTGLLFPSITVVNDTYGFVGNLNFEDCDNIACCCPVICSCDNSAHPDSIRCYWPVAYVCTGSLMPGVVETGGPTQITNLLITVDYGGVIQTYTQNGLSIHKFTCQLVGSKWCANSLYEMEVPVLWERAGFDPIQDYVQVFFDTPLFGGACKYKIYQASVVDSQNWDFDTQVSSCTSASSSGSVGPIGSTVKSYVSSFDITGAENCPCGVD